MGRPKDPQPRPRNTVPLFRVCHLGDPFPIMETELAPVLGLDPGELFPHSERLDSRLLPLAFEAHARRKPEPYFNYVQTRHVLNSTATAFGVVPCNGFTCLLAEEQLSIQFVF